MQQSTDQSEVHTPIIHKNKASLEQIQKLLTDVNILDMTKCTLQLIQSIQKDQKKGEVVIRGVDTIDVKKVVDQIANVMDSLSGIKDFLESIIGEGSQRNNKHQNINNNKNSQKQQNQQTTNPKIQDFFTQQQILQIKLDLYFKVPQQLIFKMNDAKIGSPKTDAIIDLICQRANEPNQNCKLIPTQTNNNQLPLYQYIGDNDTNRKYYTFLLVGQISSGKTTLIHTFVNMLQKVQLTDRWRYQVNTRKSKTENTNIYQINDRDNQFNVRMIDTPGIDQTTPQQKYDLIGKEFKKIYEQQIKNIDYILYVQKATVIRMSVGLKNSIERIQKLFSNYSNNKFIRVFTFSQGKEPLQLQHLSKQQKYFLFNNTPALNSSFDRQQCEIIKFYWKMNKKSIKDLQSYIKNNN